MIREIVGWFFLVYAFSALLAAWPVASLCLAASSERLSGIRPILSRLFLAGLTLLVALTIEYFGLRLI